MDLPVDYLPGILLPRFQHYPGELAAHIYKHRNWPKHMAGQSVLSHHYYILKGFTNMAKRRGNNAQPTVNTAVNGGTNKKVFWGNVRLDDNHVAELLDRMPAEDVLCAQLIGLCVEGFDISLKRANDGTGWQCTIIGDYAENPSTRFGLSAWSSTPFDAIAAVLYKWYDVLLETPPTPNDAVQSRFR